MEMKSFGVYVPEQDAAWETHENGALFDDLLERHNRCDAVDCVCPEGREADEDYTIWEIVSVKIFYLQTVLGERYLVRGKGTNIAISEMSYIIIKWFVLLF